MISLTPQKASSPISLPRQIVNIAAAAAAFLIYVLVKSGKDLDDKGRRQAVDAAAANNTAKLASSINAQGPPSKEKGINFVTRLLTQPKLSLPWRKDGCGYCCIRERDGPPPGTDPIIAPVTTKTEKGGVLPCVTSDSMIWNWTTSWSSLRTLALGSPRGNISGYLRLFLIHNNTGNVYTRNGRVDSWEQLFGSNRNSVLRPPYCCAQRRQCPNLQDQRLP